MSADPLTVKRGDTWSMVFDYTNADGSPLDLTGCEARLHVRSKLSEELLLALDTASGLTLAQEKVISLATAEQMRGMPVGKHKFDLELTYSDGRVESTTTLTLTVVEDITYDD